MNELTILLLEDDANACRAFVEYAETLEDVIIVGITNNAAKALSDISTYFPDVLILDLELHQGGGSGLDVLRGLKDSAMGNFPYVMITTNNSSQITYECARQLGADYIMSKHQEGYSEKNVIDFLLMMKSVIQNKKKTLSSTLQPAESPEQRTKRLTRRISSELNYLGISPKALGYQYLIDAILMVMAGASVNISTQVGQKYGKTESSVERAMQNALNRAWRQTDVETLMQHYTARVRPDKGIPTITEFIHYYATKLNNEY